MLRHILVAAGSWLMVAASPVSAAHLDANLQGSAGLISSMRLHQSGWTSLAGEPGAYGFRSGMALYLPAGGFHVHGSVAVSVTRADSAVQVRGVMPIVEIDQSNDINHVPAKPVHRSKMGTSIVGLKADVRSKSPGFVTFDFDFGNVECAAAVEKMQMCELVLDLWTDDDDARVLPASVLRVDKSP